MKNCVFVILVVHCVIDGLNAQDSATVYREPFNLSGPRIGLTFLSQDFVRTMRDRYNAKVSPLVAQVGWQFEHRFFTTRRGATAASEWVLLIGGFEQEKFLPSLTWLLGARSATGFEFGAGPNLSLSGTALVLTAGVTHSSGELNVPANFAVALSRSGIRFTLLLGFNIKDP